MTKLDNTKKLPSNQNGNVPSPTNRQQDGAKGKLQGSSSRIARKIAKLSSRSTSSDDTESLRSSVVERFSTSAQSLTKQTSGENKDRRRSSVERFSTSSQSLTKQSSKALNYGVASAALSSSPGAQQERIVNDGGGQPSPVHMHSMSRKRIKQSASAANRSTEDAVVFGGPSDDCTSSDHRSFGRFSFGSSGARSLRKSQTLTNKSSTSSLMARGLPDRGAHRLSPDGEAHRPAPVIDPPVINVGADEEERNSTHAVPIVAYAVDSATRDVVVSDAESGRDERIRRQLANSALVVEGTPSPVVPSNKVEVLPWWRRRWVMLLCMVVAIAIALTVTLAVVIPSSSSSSSLSNSEPMSDPTPLNTSPSPTAAPSQSPTKSPTSTRFVELRSLLIERNGVADPATLTDGTSPQFRALRWLADEDARQVDETFREGHVTQRFALATLFYSTKGEGWFRSFGFLNQTHECQWNGRLQVDDRATENNFGTEDRFGVICDGSDSGALVNKIALCENNLSGELPEEIWRLTSLTNLSICHNDLKGTISPSVGSLSNLVSLDLDFNSLTGFIPPSIGDMGGAIMNLNAVGNQLTGTMPTTVQQLSNLCNISFALNDLTGSLPFVEGNAAPLWRWVYLGGNKLNGTVPTSIGRYSDLSVVDVDNNMLSGNLPSELGSLPNLERLDFGNNKLRGDIPSTLAHATDLFQLQLDRNELTGALPPFLGNLTKLERIDLNENKLTGQLPQEMGNLSLLRILLLNDNRLNGTVPTSFVRLNSLAALRLHRNNLTGEIDFLCNKSITDLEADCLEDLIEVSCSCCLFCCNDDDCVLQNRDN